jgi:MerR family mercuric resistance operon transcriptional regulator
MGPNFEKMTIGKLAESLAINIETIRYYHREGLVKEPAKRSNGYRYYGVEHYSRILFIKKAKELGFTLSEIKGFLQINTWKRANCSDVIPKVEEKILEIDNKINDLMQIKSSLLKLRSACDLGEEEMKKFSMMDCFINDCKC